MAKIQPRGQFRLCRPVICGVLLTLSLASHCEPVAASPAKSIGKTLAPFVVGRITHFVAQNGRDDGPGTVDHPWATINHAAEQAQAGDIILVRGGRYTLSAQIRTHNSGRPNAWITFVGEQDSTAVIDAQHLSRSSLLENGLDNGAFQIQDVSYIRVINLTMINAHDAGFTIRDSSNIELINNSTKGSYSSGNCCVGHKS
jgi:hypothetical protein